MTPSIFLQHLFPLRRHAIVGILGALFVFLLGAHATTNAQYSTYADTVDYQSASQVHVDFETPSGYLPGIRDYLNYLAAANIGVDAGPISYVGNYGGVVTSDPHNDDQSIPFFRIADDISEDGVPGAVVIVDPVTGGISVLTDFDDLHEFNIGFDELGVRQGAGWRSFDVGAVYWLLGEHAENATADDLATLKTLASLETLNDAHGQSLGPSAGSTAIPMPPRWAVVPQFSRFAADRRVSGIGFIYGYNEMAIRSGFEFIGRGGILGRTDSDTEAINWIHGPQAGLVAYRRWGPISLYGHAIALAGLNDTDIHQENNIGQELIPGATNRLLYSQPTHSEHDVSYLEFSPTGLLWAEVGLHVTERTSLKFAWSAVYAYNAMLAENRVRYYLPDMGLLDPAVQHLFEQYFYCGVEVVR